MQSHALKHINKKDVHLCTSDNSSEWNLISQWKMNQNLRFLDVIFSGTSREIKRCIVVQIWHIYNTAKSKKYRMKVIFKKDLHWMLKQSCQWCLHCEFYHEQRYSLQWIGITAQHTMCWQIRRYLSWSGTASAKRYLNVGHIAKKQAQCYAAPWGWAYHK